MKVSTKKTTFEITHEEEQTLNDFFATMNYDEPFADMNANEIWDFLTFIHDKMSGKANPEELFETHEGDLIEIVYKD